MPILLPRPVVEASAGRLYSSDYQDCYFQTYSPLDEINHVYIQGTELVACWDECEAQGQRTCIIGETGFGTGLNFLVTCLHWRHWCEAHPNSQMKLHFISFELSPLDQQDLVTVYQGFEALHSFSGPLIAQWPPPWAGSHIRHFADRVQLSLLYGDATQMLKQHHFIADVWFLDGFSPRCNPSMWCQSLFDQLALHSKFGTRLATFTAAGFVRRGLDSVGFHVEVQQGFNKRHMSKARFQLSSPGQTKTETRLGSNNIIQKKKPRIAIIGAGYAGLSLASELIRQGKTVDVFDAGLPMSGASNNHAHLLYLQPKLVNNAFNRFYEQAYSYSLSHYNLRPGVQPTGVFHVPTVKQQAVTAAELAQFWPPDWLKVVSQVEASNLLGITAPGPGFWMPNAFVIQPQIWARGVIERAGQNLQLYPGHRLCEIRPTNFSSGATLWQLKFDGRSACFEYEVVVLASGVGSINLLQSLGNKCLGPDPTKQSHWRYPLRPIAGQSSELDQAKLPFGSIDGLVAAVCGECYVTPAVAASHSVGSTFHPDQFAGSVDVEGHQANMAELIETLGLKVSPASLMAAIKGGYSATRLQTTDYMPMVGSVFKEQGDHLYLLAGFGAKGACVAPFAAHMLASEICQTPSLIPPELHALVAPSRFAQRVKRFDGQGHARRFTRV